MVEYARECCDMAAANTTENDAATTDPVVCLLPEQYEIEGIGGSMRLGRHAVSLQEGSRVAELYGAPRADERFRHRYEFNPLYRKVFEDDGMVFSGWAPGQPIVQVAELPQHPFFIGVQFHPEFTSRPAKPNPLFHGFVQACIAHRRDGARPLGVRCRCRGRQAAWRWLVDYRGTCGCGRRRGCRRRESEDVRATGGCVCRTGGIPGSGLNDGAGAVEEHAMPVTAVVGANWGDEGKGKLCDYLAESSDLVIRFQGGRNAGHTVINQYGKFALHLVPCGVFYDHTTNLLGPGVAVDLAALLQELAELRDGGAPNPRVLIAERAQVVLPHHVELDRLEEARRGAAAFGSTQTGMAPFYADKYLKVGIQVGDLFDGDHLRKRLRQTVSRINVLLENLYGAAPLRLEPLVEELLALGAQVRDMVVDAATLLQAGVA